jgi:hypothetical protein
METKQTAVDWLIDQVKSEKYIDSIDFEQAKEIEKQQIVDAYQNGGIDGQIFASTRRINIENGEQYYNEKFGE